MDSRARDIQHNIAVKGNLAAVTINLTETTVQTASVDTSDFTALMFALTPSRTLVDGDDVIAYSFQHSDDNSTWEDMNGLSDLPPRLQDEGNPVKVVTNAGFLQTFGVYSNKRYVRVQFVGSATGTTVDLVLTPILRSDLSEFTEWDPDQVPNDGRE